DRPSGVPLYLTLCGGEGLEIEELIRRGVIRRTPAGNIDDEDGSKVVAVEADFRAELRLHQKFAGLSVRRQRIEDLLESTSLERWPSAEDESICRALVVNLDFNGLLDCQFENGNLTFPILQLIYKLAELHAKVPIITDWVLCLTLNSGIKWDPKAAV